MGQPKSKNNTHARRAKYRQAFEDTMTAYETMRYCSPVSIMDTSKEVSGTINGATPTPLDFFCDVETQINTIIADKLIQTKLWNTYVFGGDNTLSKSQKNYYEQRIGKLFILRSIWPIAKYFRTIKK